MILLIGIPSEPPLAKVKKALDAEGVPNVLFNQRDVDTCDMELTHEDGQVGGALHLNGRTLPLKDVTGAYARPMDDAYLPEFEGERENSHRRMHSRALHGLLLQWLEIAPGRIVNRPRAMGSNSSKPYQAQLIARSGFQIPETLITNDPSQVLAFRRRHGRIIYKSISGARSIVTEFGDGDLARLDQIRLCPTQFQERVEGTDVRVHTIGEEAFATRLTSTATDYRYAASDGGQTEMEPYALPDPWSDRCVELSRRLGLAFAGIDLKVTPEGTIYCFEVNPCPVFSYYEAHTGQPVAEAVSRYLAG